MCFGFPKSSPIAGIHIRKIVGNTYLIKNSQAVKKRNAALEKAMVKKDVKSKVAAKKWL